MAVRKTTGYRTHREDITGLSIGVQKTRPVNCPARGPQTKQETTLLIGYARCSTTHQDRDLTAQRASLISLGVDGGYIYTDAGLTGTNRDRPGLREALAAVRNGDTLVVTKLDRLARSVPDARDIATELEGKGVSLSIGGAVYDPGDPLGRLMFNVLGMVAEFEADLIRQRTREGMAVAKAKGRLRGRQPKLNLAQERHLLGLLDSGDYTTSEVAAIMGVSRGTVYRAKERAARRIEIRN